MVKEEQKLQSMNALIDNALFDALANVSDNVYIYVNDLKTHITHWSPKAVEYFNLSDEYLLDITEWYKKIHKDDYEGYMEDVAAALRGEKAHSFEYRILNKDGEYVWVECHGSLIKDEDGSPKMFAGICTRIKDTNYYDGLTHCKTIHTLRVERLTRLGVAIRIGIDNFREINNRYGIREGDLILKNFAKVLLQIQDQKPSHYSVLRDQGDEFYLLLRGETNPEKFFNEIKRKTNYIEGSNHIRYNISVTAAACVISEEGVEVRTLLENLGYTMAEAKEEARGELTLYTPDIRRKYLKRSVLSNELKKAIDKNFEGFELYYQPMVDPVLGLMGACESLLRWHNKSFPNANIANVVEVIEAMGKMGEVGNWIIRENFKNIKRWQESNQYFTVSINVSYYQLLDEDFVDYIIDEATAFKVNPTLISLELTERSKIENIDEVAKSMKRLKEYGFSTSLDDFGTEFSNLELLNVMDFDTLKIDQSFIRGITSSNYKTRIIVENMINLAKRLNIRTVVEGVETKEIVKTLEPYNINLIQGYYYSKPLPVKEFEKTFGKTYK